MRKFIFLDFSKFLWMRYRDHTEITIHVHPEKVDEAQAIFTNYDSRLMSSRDTEFQFVDGGCSVDYNSNKPNRRTLCYFVRKDQSSELSDELIEAGIAGTNRHDSIFIETPGILRTWLMSSRSLVIYFT